MKSSDDTTSRQSMRSRALARLATLQRLREEAAAKRREAMLQSIDQLIQMEVLALRRDQSSGAQPTTPRP